MTYVIVSSGHLRGLHGLGADAPVSPEVHAILEQANGLLTRLAEQRDRIAAENFAFKAATKAPTILAVLAAVGIGEFNSRINATDTLVAQLENFVVNVFNRVEAQARDPKRDEKSRLAAAQRLLTATTNILRTAGDTSPIDDLSADIKQTVKEVGQDAKKALDPNAWEIPFWAYGLGAVVGLYYLSNIVSTLKPKQ